MIEHKTILLEQLHEQDNKEAVINSADSCPTTTLKQKNVCSNDIYVECILFLWIFQKGHTFC